MLLPAEVLLPLVVALLRKRSQPRRKKRKRYVFSGSICNVYCELIYVPIQESDEDMGFGLFD